MTRRTTGGGCFGGPRITTFALTSLQLWKGERRMSPLMEHSPGMMLMVPGGTSQRVGFMLLLQANLYWRSSSDSG